ncbi:MAG: TIGR02266 family protein [Myxococcota bacterium]|nr:TIGR02266 family protein [Myxococcota bacterium]MDW8362332.1 TIGR02266 family protein [Myxococcales bacterium]
MTYSGASVAREAREGLSRALAALQEDPNVPADVMSVAENVAHAVGSLFEAERASTEPDGKAGVRSALGYLSQTLALLQNLRSDHRGVATAAEALAQSMSKLYPLTVVPSRLPPAASGAANVVVPPSPAVPRVSSASPAPTARADGSSPAAPAAGAPPPVAAGTRVQLEANIGATTESNFYVGFSGDIGEGGVFIATYETLPRGTPVEVLVTLPGGFETRVLGRVRFVRDPLDFGADSEPGMGVQFESLTHEQRELVLRFIRKRPPIFYDD